MGKVGGSIELRWLHHANGVIPFSPGRGEFSQLVKFVGTLDGCNIGNRVSTGSYAERAVIESIAVPKNIGCQKDDEVQKSDEPCRYPKGCQRS